MLNNLIEFKWASRQSNASGFVCVLQPLFSKQSHARNKNPTVFYDEVFIKEINKR